MRAFAAVLVLALAGCSAGTERDPASDPSGIESFDDLTNEHKPGRLSYAQDPPVGGDHNAQWLACDIYDLPVPNEFAVHAMEHGGVWVTHDPDLPAEQVQQLEALTALNEEYVLVSPYDGLRSPVVVSTWGLQLRVEDADDPRLTQFVEAYAGGPQGGEPGAPCKGGGLSLDEATALLED